MTGAESSELHALRRALGDMAALSSLPAMWINADETKIAESVADALLRVLDLDAVRVIHAIDGRCVEITRLHESGRTTTSDLEKANFPGSGTISDRLAGNNALKGFSCSIGVSDT